MVDFSIPNLCGASPDFNKLMSQFDSIKGEILGGLELDAGAMASTLTTSLNQLEADLRAMIPELPSLPAVNFQAEVTSLISLPAGSNAYISKLATLQSQFGSQLPNLESVVSDALSSVLAGGDVCGVCPNLELPAGATEAIELAKSSLQPTVDALKEPASAFSTDESVDEVKAIYGDAVSKKEEELVQTAAAAAPAAAVSKEKSEYERLNELYKMQKHARGAEKLRKQIMKLFVGSFPNPGAMWQKRGPYPGSKPGQAGVNPYTDGNISIPMPEPDNIINFDDVVTALYKK